MFGNGSNDRKIEKGKVVMESTENEEGIGKKNGGKERPQKKKIKKKHYWKNITLIVVIDKAERFQVGEEDKL